jgi:hypothetical protein
LSAPEATDCLQEGPGLPPKWPYRLMPDHSSPMKLGQCPALFKSVFSMAVLPMIADIALTSLPRFSRKARAFSIRGLLEVAVHLVTTAFFDKRFFALEFPGCETARRSRALHPCCDPAVHAGFCFATHETDATFFVAFRGASALRRRCLTAVLAFCRREIVPPGA